MDVDIYRDWKSGEDYWEYLKNSPDDHYLQYWNWKGWDNEKTYTENLHWFNLLFSSYIRKMECWYMCKKGWIGRMMTKDEEMEFWEKYIIEKYKLVKPYLKD
jgi:hypothetical protein